MGYSGYGPFGDAPRKEVLWVCPCCGQTQWDIRAPKCPVSPAHGRMERA